MASASTTPQFDSVLHVFFGIFARLYIRDGKDGYLKDIPRTVGYIKKLEGIYPELEGLVGLIEQYIP